MDLYKCYIRKHKFNPVVIKYMSESIMTYQITGGEDGGNKHLKQFCSISRPDQPNVESSMST